MFVLLSLSSILLLSLSLLSPPAHSVGMLAVAAASAAAAAVLLAGKKGIAVFCVLSLKAENGQEFHSAGAIHVSVSFRNVLTTILASPCSLSSPCLRDNYLNVDHRARTDQWGLVVRI